MIDKSIRQHYEIQGGKRKRFLHGAMGASATPGATSGGGGEGPQGPPSIISRPAPVVTTAVAPPSILARDAPTIPTVEAPPGEKFGPGYVSPEDLQKQEFRKIIAQGQEEKFGDTADPTKFGETISDIDRVTSKPESDWTIEDKLTIEDWEKEQDWEKVEELADRGESFEDIQAAMNKGLLLKEDAIRRQGLIERGLAALKPTTKLESSLLGSLKKTFDPRRLATNFALRKLGLGWLNPVMGLASLFGLPQKAKSMFASRRAPAFDPKKASQLGLYADRQPTGTTQFAKRVGDRKTTAEKIVSGEVDLAKLISGNNRTLVADVSQKDIGRSKERQFKSMDYDLYKMMNPGTKITPFEFKGLQEGTITEPGTYVGAKGGRVDKALGGRSRDI